MAYKTTVKISNTPHKVSAAPKLPVVASVSGGHVDIYDQDANVIAQIGAPGVYNVIVLSGISGGNASTTFTNSIVANP